MNSPSDFTRGYDGGGPTPRPPWRCTPRPAAPPPRRSSSASTSRWTRPGGRLAAPWFRGINSVLGVDRTGIYGGVNELGWAIADGVVGASTPGYHWAWQTKAWSGGKRAPGGSFQREVVTATDPGALIDGVSVDVDDAGPDFGQWTCRDDRPVGFAGGLAVGAAVLCGHGVAAAAPGQSNASSSTCNYRRPSMQDRRADSAAPGRPACSGRRDPDVCAGDLAVPCPVAATPGVRAGDLRRTARLPRPRRPRR